MNRKTVGKYVISDGGRLGYIVPNHTFPHIIISSQPTYNNNNDDNSGIYIYITKHPDVLIPIICSSLLWTSQQSTG